MSKDSERILKAFWHVLSPSGVIKLDSWTTHIERWHL